MRRILAALLLWPALVVAGSTTTNLSLYKPAEAEVGWASLVNANFNTLDDAVLHTGTVLTSGRVPVVSTGGELADTANFTYDLTNFRLRLQNATTASDNATNMFQLSGTLPTTPTATVAGAKLSITSAGTTSQVQDGMSIQLLAGYTGSSMTRGLAVSNNAAGTGATLNLNSVDPAANIGWYADTSGTTTGINIGATGFASGSTTQNIGHFGKAKGTDAGTNIGVLGNAANSTEASDLKNVAGYFTLSSSLITGSNIDAGLIVDNGAVAASIARFYDNGVLVANLADGGSFDAVSLTESSNAVPNATNNLSFFAATTSAQLAGVISDETGSGLSVFATSPSLTTPDIGAATGASLAVTGNVTSSNATNIGWSVVNAANQACNTTCTSACVVGLDTAAVGNFLACTDATADTCLCAGAS